MPVTPRWCEACQRTHRPERFAAPADVVCVQSKALARRSAASAARTTRGNAAAPWEVAMRAVEAMSGLPVQKWIGPHRHWHVTWSDMMRAQARAAGTWDPSWDLRHAREEDDAETGADAPDARARGVEYEP